MILLLLLTSCGYGKVDSKAKLISMAEKRCKCYGGVHWVNFRESWKLLNFGYDAMRFSCRKDKAQKFYVDIDDYIGEIRCTNENGSLDR